jgi:hypothetical protein
MGKLYILSKPSLLYIDMRKDGMGPYRRADGRDIRSTWSARGKMCEQGDSAGLLGINLLGQIE